MPVLTDFAAVLRRPAFWSSYYGGRIADTEDESGGAFLTRVLGDDPDFDHEGLWGPDPYDVITDEMDDDEEDEAMEAAMAAGALFRIPFPSGHTWSIRFSSSPGVFHGLTTPDGGDRISLGYDDPHFHLPILRWPEAHRVAACLGGSQESEGTALPSEFVLPLLAPVTWATSAAEAADA
ncbi:hypothetical protein, partial [Yinghuangia sp. YIM S09857]|uniref:hypothetical protein n=1 Tax=Yinghuangia sp. YIM S09857 TaxID=3436929 RepID=UPI003F539802